MSDTQACSEAKHSQTAYAFATPELLALLDREIEHANQRMSWAGWTPWALMTALAALLGGAASKVDEVVAPAVVFQSAVFALIVIEVVRRGREFLRPSRSLGDEGRVLVSSEVLGEHRPALALELIYAGVALWGAGTFAVTVAPWQNTLVILWGAVMGLTALIGILYSAWPVPMPVGVSGTSPVRLLLQGLPILLPVLGAVAYGSAILERGVVDIQVGLLLGAAAVVLLELASEPDEPPLVSELAELRRSVALGDTDLAEGLKRTTIILRGLKLEDYVQQDASRMLRSVASLGSAVRDFRPVVDEINHLADSIEAKTVPDGQVLNGLLARWEIRGAEATERHKRAERWRRRYTRRLEFASALARFWHLSYEGEALLAEIKPKVETAMSEYKDLVEQYLVALARLERVLSAAGLVK